MQVLSARQTLYSNSYITFDWPLVSHFPAIYQSKYQLQPANGRCTQITFSVNKFTFVFSVPSTACYMWFNYFILGLHFILLCFWVWKCKVMSLKQRKIKFKPQIELNQNEKFEANLRKPVRSQASQAFHILFYAKLWWFVWEFIVTSMTTVKIHINGQSLHEICTFWCLFMCILTVLKSHVSVAFLWLHSP